MNMDEAVASISKSLLKGSNNTWLTTKMGVEHQGSKIILPNDPRPMTYEEGIQMLNMFIEENNKEVGINEIVECFPLEGAWALRKVLEHKFGNVMTADPSYSMFGGKQPGATMVTIKTGPNKTEQALQGRFMIPGVTGELKTGVHFDPYTGNMSFAIKGVVRKRDQETVKEIADMVREFVHVNSLYRGKAIKIRTVEHPEMEDRYIVDFNTCPEFIDISRIKEDELIFSTDVKGLIQTNLFTPIEKTPQCRKARIPLGRKVLLEGPFGTGKTLTAYVTAKKCEENGWTFVYMDRAQALKDVLIFARRYAPCAIFCEDIEQVAGQNRDTSVNDVLNNIDGLDSKGHEMICIFTTNNVEKIHPAMLRPGRLDAVITVLPPDAQAAEKLVRVYAREMLAADADISTACKELEGQIPAFIRETVERAKLFALGHLEDGAPLTIGNDDIRLAAVGMKRHLKLVNRQKPVPLTPGDKLGIALHEIINDNSSDRSEDDRYASEENAINHRNAITAEAEALRQ